MNKILCWKCWKHKVSSQSDVNCENLWTFDVENVKNIEFDSRNSIISHLKRTLYLKKLKNFDCQNIIDCIVAELA